MNPLPCLLALALAGCTGTVSALSNAAQTPGEIACKGKTVVSIIGSTGPVAGVNGSVTADCGAEGAFIRWGPPSSTN